LSQQDADLELAREFAGWPAPEPDGNETPNFAKVLDRPFARSPFDSKPKNRG
jgi:hypothetical protein